MKIKILVTGSSGFIGSHLTEYLVKKGYNIVSGSDSSRFNYEYIQSLISSTINILDEGMIKNNHYEGILRLLKSPDPETLEMAEKIVFANLKELENKAA